MQDAFAMFDIASDLTDATAFASGVTGTYPSTKSYDTYAAGVPAVPSPRIGT